MSEFSPQDPLSNRGKRRAEVSKVPEGLLSLRKRRSLIYLSEARGQPLPLGLRPELALRIRELQGWSLSGVLKQVQIQRTECSTITVSPSQQLLCFVLR
jgi:hypothetical protein